VGGGGGGGGFQHLKDRGLVFNVFVEERSIVGHGILRGRVREEEGSNGGSNFRKF